MHQLQPEFRLQPALRRGGSSLAAALWAVGGALALWTVGLGTVGDGRAWGQGPMPPAPIVAAEIVEQEVAVGQTFVATVTPLKRSAVGSAVDGRVAQFPVKHGDRVKKGQALAQLLTETIQAQVDNAAAELVLREQELLELKNGARPEEIRMSEAKMQRSKALFEYAQSRYARIEQLFRERRSISEDEYDQAKSVALETDQAFRDAKANHELTVAGARKERIAQAEARVVMQEALVKQYTDQLRKHTMISPFDGYVVAEHTEIGQWVSRGQLVAEVVSLDEVDVQAAVQESQIQYVRVGMEVRVEIPSLSNQIFVGRVALIVPDADRRSRTFPVVVRLQNKIDDESGPLIKAGMLCRVVLPTGPQAKAQLAPKDSIVLGGATPAVFVVDLDPANPKQGVVRPVPVTLGVASGNSIEIIGDLRSAQDKQNGVTPKTPFQVVVQGNERLRPGQPVVMVPAIELQGTTKQ